MKASIISLIFFLEILSNQTRFSVPRFADASNCISRLIWPPPCKTTIQNQGSKEERLC